MAQPASRTDLINYCKRQLGAPVLEINVADEQIEDLVVDAIQYFHERHFDGVIQTFLHYKITEDDINRGKGPGTAGVSGITTTTVTESVGVTTQFSFTENNNYIKIPPAVIGVNKIFRFDGSNTTTNNMFSVKYQLFLNDIYGLGSTEILSYAMTKRYLEDLDFALNTEKRIRFNQRQDRLYLDIDWGSVKKDEYLVLDCYRAVSPTDFASVYNDFWLKKYVTSLIKKQWGQNLIKFQGVLMPGGVQLNGRQLYDDAMIELEALVQELKTEYEMPPLDMIG